MTPINGLYSIADNWRVGQYCGPSAIAALTGIPIAAVEDAVLAHRAELGIRFGKSRKTPHARVYGMSRNELAPVIERLGWRATHLFKPAYKHECRALTRLAYTFPKDVPLLVIVTGHAIAVRGSYFVDTRFREPRRLAFCPYMRKRVTNVIALAPKGSEPCAP